MLMPFSPDLFICLTLISAFMYLCSAGIVATHIVASKAFNRQRSIVLTSTFISILIHLSLVVHSYSINNTVPYDFFNMLSLIFFVISVLFLLTALTHPIETLAVVVLPFSAIAVLLNIGNETNTEVSLALEGALQTHILLSVVSYSLLTVAAFQAIFLSIQEKQLHDRQVSRFISSLPPLQLMERLLFRTLSLGVLLLTFALATGFIYLDDIFAQQIAHKTVLSIVAWFVFATLLCGRHYLGWRGQLAVKWTYGGYFALMLAYFGSKFVLQLVLNQG